MLALGRQPAGHDELRAGGAVEQPGGHDRPGHPGGGGQLQLDGQLAGQPFVVIVEQGGPRCPGLAGPGVAGVRGAALHRQRDRADAGVAELGQRLRGRLVRSVDDHDDLEVRHGLREDAADRTGHQLGAVAGRDDHADLGGVHDDGTLRAPVVRHLNGRWPAA
ncbi:hypothetical protein Asp14428_04940 [Actinoplanes sp. NBRC 14428]|nr:hypothetical protein Asp14428_04940 [Actinoplanes sp. NBRC 14428]